MANRNTRQSPGGRWYQDDEFQTSPQSSREMSPLRTVNHNTGETKYPLSYKVGKRVKNILTNPYIDAVLGAALVYGAYNDPELLQLAIDSKDAIKSGVKRVSNYATDKFHKIQNSISSAYNNMFPITNTTTTNATDTNSTTANITDVTEAGNHSEYL